MSSTLFFVSQKIRKPSPFLRSRPFAQSSCPIMKDTSPAFSDTPTTLPSGFFQVSSTPNPRTPVYQARLRSRSFTVKLGDAVRSASGPPAARGFAAALFALAVPGELFRLRERAVFADFLVAMVKP